MLRLDMQYKSETMNKKRQLPKKKIIRFQVFRGMLNALKNS
jgi:hypothetical protein